MKLTESQIEANLKELPEWKRSNHKWIERKYRFDSYLDGIAFVKRAAEWAESKQHHPLIAIDYKVVTLRLTTWKAAGLTALDFESASAYDRMYE